jgi:hypothetical protein
MGEIETDEHVRVIETNEPATRAVLGAVASVSGTPPLELPPLQEFIDADALNRLFVSSEDVKSLQFDYTGYEVTVEPTLVRVRERR